MRIGLVPLSAKPFTVGHYRLVYLASGECDVVKLFVSTSDRVRPGEAPVLGSDMVKVWKEHLAETMPPNADVAYGGSPVGNVLKVLGKASEEGSTDEFVVYSDENDAQANFGAEVLKKYASKLVSSDQVKVRPVSRAETYDISGTEMRGYLSSGDKASFTKGLPPGIDKDAVWELLYRTAKNPPTGLKPTYVKRKKVPQSEAVVVEVTLLKRLVHMILG